MKFLKLNPTVRQTNRYLDKLVSNLKTKHGGVSNEDFENELVKTTGIGWKQVKNYKNHPKPNERLKDNAIVLKYIVQEQNRDKGRKILRSFTTVTLIAFTLSLIYWYESIPKKIETFMIHQIQPKSSLAKSGIPTEKSGTLNDLKSSQIFFNIEKQKWFFRLGPLKISKISLDRFNCTENEGLGSKSCTFSEIQSESAATLQAFVLLDGEVVRKFSILTYDQVEINSIMSQLKKIFADEILDFPDKLKNIDQRTLTKGDEKIVISSSNPDKGMKPFISVVVSFK